MNPSDFWGPQSYYSTHHPYYKWSNPYRAALNVKHSDGCLCPYCSYEYDDYDEMKYWVLSSGTYQSDCGTEHWWLVLIKCKKCKRLFIEEDST